MVVLNILKTAVVAISVASVGVVSSSVVAASAFAKGGNGNSGGNDGGGAHGHGADNGHGSDANNGKKSGHDDDRVGSHGSTRKEKMQTSRNIASASDLRGLNSLNRNYTAYLNSNDLRLAGVASYVQNYARYELRTGMVPSVDDPELGDAALRDALSGFSKTTITSRQLDWAKDVLGVGSSVGKIDQVRAAMDKQASASK